MGARRRPESLRVVAGAGARATRGAERNGFARHGAFSAQSFLGEAVRLRPGSWTFRRQKIAAANEEAVGELAATPEYWEAVNKLGDRPYYEPIDMPGMPE